MKIIFLGSGEFSTKVLETLTSKIKIHSVVTTLDKRQGRGQQFVKPLVKQFAEKNNIKCFQCEKVSKDGLTYFQNEKPDIVVTAAFGQILSKEFLEIPKIAVLNVHGSILPKYRGASPIQQAVIDGEKETGVSIMRTVYDLDAGDILLCKKISIDKSDTSQTVFDKVAQLGGEAIIEAIKLIESGEYSFTPQDHTKATYTKMIKKEDARIDFNKTAEEICNHVRGMYNWPIAFFSIKDEIIKVHECEVVNDDTNKVAGTVELADNKNGLIVNCGKGQIRLSKIQKLSGKVLEDKVFLNGYKIHIGTILND